MTVVTMRARRLSFYRVLEADRVPASLRRPGAAQFWAAVALTGAATGLGAIALTRILEMVQRAAWGGTGTDLLRSVESTGAWRRVLILSAAGLVIAAGQFALKRLTSGSGIDTSAAIWFHAGRMPAVRTLGSAVLSVIGVGMGVSLGREGAPKQAGAVFANLFADKLRLSDERRRLLVACGAGAGMAGAYGVPLGGAVFSLEVMRGILGLRYILPSLLMSVIATGVSWLGLPDRPVYTVPAYVNSVAAIGWALVFGPIAGAMSVAYVRAIAWADRNKAADRWRLVTPVAGLAALGAAAIVFPQLLGNGRDVSQLAFTGAVAPALALALLLLKPAATILCVRCGAPGGLFTPSLTVGAMFGAASGYAWSLMWPGAPAGLYALLGAAAMEAAITQGPISTAVLMIEFTGWSRSFMLPMLLAIGTATIVARTLELRSIYDARLTDEQVEQRRQMREQI